jgi:hypothetical protein
MSQSALFAVFAQPYAPIFRLEARAINQRTGSWLACSSLVNNTILYPR